MKLFSVLAGACASLLVTAMPGAANPKLVVDVNSLKVYEQQDIYQKWYPASLTKLMTAYTTFRALKSGQLTLESPVVISKNAAGEPPSKMFYKPGQAVTLDSALKMLLIKSANDIAVAIGETVAGSEPAFVNLMNAEAKRIGMTSSHFINPNGLPGAGQYTTARDLAVLAVTIKREFPQYAPYFAYEGFTTGKKNYPNLNMLIGRFDGADGMKTGFICASGFNQVSSATRNGRAVVSVVLGAESLGGRADEFGAVAAARPDVDRRRQARSWPDCALRRNPRHGRRCQQGNLQSEGRKDPLRKSGRSRPAETAVALYPRDQPPAEPRCRWSYPRQRKGCKCQGTDRDRAGRRCQYSDPGPPSGFLSPLSRSDKI